MLPRVLVSPFRTTTLWATILRQNWDWDKASQIVPGLYLGSIPINKAPCGRGKRFTNTVKQISEFIHSKDPTRPLKLIASVVEPEELKGEGFWGVETIEESELKENGIERRLLKMCDHDLKARVNRQEAVDLLFEMNRRIKNNESVYVHCKAGCERSAMLTVIYLAAFEINPKTNRAFTIEEAIGFLQGKRKQITVAGAKLERAHEILAAVKSAPQYEAPQPVAGRVVYANPASFWQRHARAAFVSTLVAGVAVTAAYRMSSM